MFQRGGFIVLRVLLFLLIIGGLIAGGVWLYNSGQAQGYALGLAANDKAPAAPSQALPGQGYYPGYFYGPGYGPWFGRAHFFPFFGLFFFCGIPLLFIFLISGAIHRHGWRHHGWEGRPVGGPWEHHHWHGPEQPKEEQQPPESEPKNP